MPVNILMPALSPTMTDGTLSKWLKQEGDDVKAGDVIAEIETDKATMEVEAVDEGKLGKILVAAGTSNVAVNAPIAVLLEEGEDISSIGSAPTSNPIQSTVAQTLPSPSPATPTHSVEPSMVTGSNKPQSGGGRIFSSPLARRLAEQKGVDLKSIQGSGPYGRIVKADIEDAKVGAVSSVPNSVVSSSGPDAKQLADMLGMEYIEFPNNNIKKVTARRLTEAKQVVPHFYLSVDCVLDNLLKARSEINAVADGAFKLSVNDFIIKANAMSLKAYPSANTSWTDDAVIQYKHADISIAVATPNGLITPIIKAAETKSLHEISNEMKDLAKRAKDGKLKPIEFQGGSFSISNLGMFGVKNFQAIVNPPQSCIMAVGAGEERVVVENGQMVIRTVMTVTLSTDHRSVDGAVGAEYLQHFKRFIENPVLMLA
ncbi:MAG TPA: pyruvate dehydrogenase complex dihydrolipoamide acetyltransferase [Alphaproteobacteria bacterium]|nr:pyruvate dehydrogenase complex dihydrolipoamide acetyltransferase [Alphaproteobacteria bacterium]HRK97243.1 pyruvate dehydrogenase complex dihydrolipoamide acetyltransferase [Alphaproteobacteria bacterium]